MSTIYPSLLVECNVKSYKDCKTHSWYDMKKYKNYKEIIIGKVSTKQMVSNITGNLYKPTKRRLLTLSHYRFRMKLKSMAAKYNANIVEVSEYLTSKTCCVCGNINDNLGASKTYNCDRCKIIIDRDINSAINIYENKVLSR